VTSVTVVMSMIAVTVATSMTAVTVVTSVTGVKCEEIFDLLCLAVWL